MLKRTVLSLVTCFMLSGCGMADSEDVPVKSVEGVVISDEVCQVGQKCEAVIARDQTAWTYQIAEGPFKKGTVLYKACAYHRTHERCSSVWSPTPDRFIPPESKN